MYKINDTAWNFVTKRKAREMLKKPLQCTLCCGNGFKTNLETECKYPLLIIDKNSGYNNFNNKEEAKEYFDKVNNYVESK